ncbi:MAG: adenosylcobinamide-GDP ribazoletransferase [Spirulina sp. SIO3F2]|nr:adenosylcobinamide-GDP ribazoletransferase [Spirulina sp. SIO3F2]
MQYFQRLGISLKNQVAALGGAILFYTRFLWPESWPVDLTHIAYLAPWVGCGLGCLLAIGDRLLICLHFPPLTASILLVALWLWSTGGLHLDGAMDTADGLAVTDPERRLVVMRDSVTGAFGVMVAVLILVLKGGAIAELELFRGWSLVMAAGWGRWGQVLAIAQYPYLRPEGKGAFHKETFKAPQDLLWGLVLLLGLMALQISLAREKYLCILICMVWGLCVSWLAGWWFARQLGGHTGDTYGAVVEWTEAVYLMGVLGISQWV